MTLPQPATLVEEIAKRVRFASTKFLDGRPFGDPQTSNPIEIKLIAVFRLERPALGGGTERSDPVPVTATVQVMPYNKVLSFAIDTVNKEADEVISQRFAMVPEHSIVPDFWEDPVRRSKNELSTLLRHPTVFFVCTHGSEIVYSDSYWDAGVPDQTKLISRSENMGFCYANRSAATPPMNFAILYSCATLYGSGDPGWPFSFGLWDPYGVLLNKAYAGFPQIISDSWDGERGSSHRLRDHARQLIAYLREGLTMSVAVAYANRDTQAIVPMEARGDGFARMFLVYLTPEEISTVPKEVVNSWYYIY